MSLSKLIQPDMLSHILLASYACQSADLRAADVRSHGQANKLTRFLLGVY
jgi:hypothetical protein